MKRKNYFTCYNCEEKYAAIKCIDKKMSKNGDKIKLCEKCYLQRNQVRRKLIDRK